MKFRCSFSGRLSTSIGNCYPITTVMEANCPQHARQRLYEKWDHISGLVIRTEDEQHAWQGHNLEQQY